MISTLYLIILELKLLLEKAAVTFSGSNDTGAAMVTIDEEKNNNENLLQEVEIQGK